MPVFVYSLPSVMVKSSAAGETVIFVVRFLVSMLSGNPQVVSFDVTETVSTASRLECGGGVMV